MKRLLFIAHRVPYPPDKGERVRAYHEICALSAHFHVTVAALAHHRADRQAADALRGRGFRVLTAPVESAGAWARGVGAFLLGRSVTEGYFRCGRLARRLAAEGAGEAFDLVLGYSSSMLPYVLAVPARSRVVDLVDVDSAKWRAYADRSPWPKGALYGAEANRVAALERRAVVHCDAVLVVSDAEAAAMGPAGEKITPVANGVDAEFYRPDAVAPADLGPESLVFTGTMDYRPNIEGVCWFVRQVWGRLKRRLPRLTLTIVGRNPTPAVRKLAARRGVTVTGTVDDDRGYLAGAGLVICPLRMARGIQNKVLIAMAMGKAVIASPPALEGLNVERGRHVVEADEPVAWRREVSRLLTGADVRSAIGRAAREHVCAHYTWEARMAPLVDLCRGLCEPGGSA